jgi:3-oxoacyl-[acyl-carrier-protein] synthase-1
MGAVTPLGWDAWSSSAAVRAGISGMGFHAFMADAAGRPMQVAAFPWMAPEQPIARRIAEALVPSIDQVLRPLNGDGRPVGLLVNLPVARPGLPEDLARQVGAALSERFGSRLGSVRFAALGHAGGLIAMRSASEWLAANPQSCCIVAGVDSYLEPDLLEWLEQTEQLHGAGERNNAWGFIPGEGAGALLLTRLQNAAALDLAPLGRVRSVGIGQEAQLIGTGSVCLGEGLTQAVRSIMPLLADSETFSDVYCDMNGEPYRADEYAFLVTRTRERFVSASDFVAPADCWGDVGAATGPLLVMLACAAGAKRYANGLTTLIWSSSTGGERAAMLLDLPAPAH